MSTIKIGVFVDAENMRYNGGYQLRYDILRRFAARNGGTLLRLNVYLAFDGERAKEDTDYARRGFNYQNTLRDFGWKVITKQVKRYVDGDGNVTTKANADLDLAVDAMLQAENLDEILLVSGDGDFLQLVSALQNKGCRVELLAFDNVSRQLQRQVDAFHSGYLIPDLVPIADTANAAWGKPGSLVRGYCSRWIEDKGYGFVNFVEQLDGNLWMTDHRDPGSPWASAFCHINELSDGLQASDLLSRDTIVEFEVGESDQKDGGLVARRVRRVVARER